jgi:DNA-binding transcriptional MerR regulator
MGGHQVDSYFAEFKAHAVSLYWFKPPRYLIHHFLPVLMYYKFMNDPNAVTAHESIDNSRLSLDDLCRLSTLPKRTVRYYAQIGLLAKPFGEKRGAHYGPVHVEQLLRIRNLSEAGVSLDRIRSVLNGESSPVAVAPKAVGSITVRSHVSLGPGLELVISPEEAQLNPEGLRRLVEQLSRTYLNTLESLS